jgi:hypothetical protein
MNAKHDIVFKRCGCTDADTGRQVAGHCPHLAEPGHGSWYYAVQVTTVGGRSPASPARIAAPAPREHRARTTPAQPRPPSRQ